MGQKRILKLGLAIAGLSCLAALLILLYIQTADAHRRALRQVERLAREQGIDFRASRLDFDLWNLRVRLEGIRVAAQNELPPILEATSIDLRLRLSRLADRLVVVERAGIEGLRLRYFRAADGRDNLPKVRAAGTSTRDSFWIEQIEGTGSLEVDDRLQGVAIRLPQYSVRAQGIDSKKLDRVEIQANAPGSAEIKSYRLEISSMLVKASRDGEKFAIHAAEVSSGEWSAGVDGSVIPGNPAVFDLKWRAAAESEWVRAKMPSLPLPLTGRIEASGEFSDPTFVSIRSLKSKELAASGTLGFEKQKQSRFEVELRGLDLARVVPSIAGRIGGKGELVWPGLELLEASGNFQADIVPGSQTGRTAIGGRISAQMERGALALELHSIVAAGVALKGNVEISRGRSLSGSILASVGDVNATWKQVAADVPAVFGSASLEATLGGSVENPEVRATVLSSDLRVSDLQVLEAKALLRASRTRIALEEARLLYQGRELLLASGEIELDRPAARRFDAAFRQIPIAILAEVTKQSVPLAGEVSGTLRSAGESGSGSITATGLEAYGEKFGTLNADFAITGGLVQVDPIVLRKPGSEITASGRYDLEKKEFALQSQSDGFALDGLRVGENTLKGRAAFQLRGEGSLQRPRVSMDIRAGGVQVDEHRIGDVTAKAELLDGTVRFESNVPRYAIDAEGVLSAPAPHRGDVTVKLGGTQLAEWAQGIEGSARGTLRATGDFAEWRKLTVTFDGVEVQSGESKITLSGMAPLEEAGRMDLRVGARVRGEDANALLAARGIPVTMRGAAEADLRVQGTLRQPEARGTIAIDADSIQHPATGEIRGVAVRGVAAGDVVRIEEAKATASGWNLEGTGALPLQPGRAAELHLNWSGDDLSKLVDPRLRGKLAGGADLQISGTHPRNVAAQITLTTLNLDLHGATLALRDAAKVNLRGGVARIEQFELEGTGGRLKLSGEASLLEPRPVNVTAEGNLNAAILSLFAEDVTTSGEIQVHAKVAGTVTSPVMSGSAELARVDAAIPAVNLRLEGIRARIDFTGDRIALTRATGTANGGTLFSSGGLRLRGGQVSDVVLNVTAANVYLDYPENLKTLSNVALQLRSQKDGYELRGDVQVLEGSYQEDVNPDELLLKKAATVAGVEDTSTESLRKLALNVAVRTATPVLVDNNLAKATVTADLRVSGTAQRPGVSGKVMLEEGGELRLTERTYLIERGVLTFTDERQMRPELDVLARTQVSGIDIALQVQSSQGKVETTLTSDPPRSETDIMALLVTGRTADRLQEAAADITREQVLSYLTSRVGGALGREVERAVGLSTVRIQPNLIAPESDPSARLTIGQDFTKDLRLTYSQDLARSNERLWLVEWDVSRRFFVRGLKDFDNVYRGEFRHEINFGVPKSEEAKTSRPRVIATVEFSGNEVFSDEQLGSILKIKPGQERDFFQIRKGVERMEAKYRALGYLESRIRTGRTIGETETNLRFRVHEGARLKFAYEGWTAPGSVQKQVRDAWMRGVFETGRLQAAAQVLRNALLKDRYLQSSVTSQVRESGDEKQVVFEVQRGRRFDRIDVEFEGAAKMPAGQLKRFLAAYRPKEDVYLRPAKVAGALTRHYRQEGYLEASVGGPRLEVNAGSATARLVVPVSEGVLFSISAIRFAGNQAIEDKELRKEMKLFPGEVYRSEAVQAAADQVASRYSEAGFNEAEIELQATRSGGEVELTFRIREGRQTRFSEILIAGNRRTSAELIRTQANLRSGDVMNAAKLSEARRNLYRTGAYSLVDIETEEVASEEGKRVRATVQVRELPPLSLRYGGLYESDRGPGGIFDLVTRSTFGSARVAGVRGRYDGQLQEIRGYFSQPLLKRFPVGTTSTVFLRRELRPAFITERTGFSVVQESKFGKHYVLNYGYKLEKTHTYDREPDPIFPFDIRLRTAALQTTLTRDNRDDILDATRGSFLSQSFEFAPKALGSELSYIRHYAQYFQYIPLTEPSLVPWSNGLRRPRLIYAGAVRAGAGRGLGGQELVPSERFFAGGGSSIRGFETDSVGPLDGLGNPLGGNAVFVTNHELRFPVASIVEAVGFFDAGNVFDKASAFRPWDVRTTSGVGLRIRTPYFLFRLDYGVKLDRKPGENFGRWFFSIGQAF